MDVLLKNISTTLHINRIITIYDFDMAISKKNKFNSEDAVLADVLKALSHPARIRILKILMDMKVCICSDIVEQMPLSQATVSQHLKELKRVGLIKGEIDGPKVCYCLDHEQLRNLKLKFDELFSRICNS